jgi:microcin C transport system substrate-binding protein
VESFILVHTIKGFQKTINSALFMISLACPLVHGSGVDLPKQHGVAMHGSCSLGEDFQHFPYVNPLAPKGGTLRLASVSPAFTTLNPFCPGPTPPPSAATLLFDPLMRRSPEEPFSLYSCIAERIQWPEDRSFLILHLNPKARFQSGLSITPEDVAFTIELLGKHGSPGRRAVAQNIEKITPLGPHSLRIDFKKNEDGNYDRELPMLVLIMSVLSKEDLKGKSFENMGLTPLVGSGPYKVKQVDPGKSIVYQRDPNYWGKDLPCNRGKFNVDTFSIEIFHNDMTAFEAFKRGLIDLWAESNLNRWRTGYTFPALSQGKVRRVVHEHHQCVGLYGIALNQIHHKALADDRIRKALWLSFDVDTYAKQLGDGSIPTQSFFQNTEFAADSPTPLLEEKKILDTLPPHCLKESHLPVKPSHASREKAIALLKQAGCTLEKGRVFWNGHPLVFQCIVKNAEQARIAIYFSKSLEKIGIECIVKQLSPTHFTKCVNDRDYDMMMHIWGHTFSPGAEQALYWHSKNIHSISRNYACIQNPCIDALCDKITNSKTRESLVHHVRVLDRVLRDGRFILPLFHNNKNQFAFWNRVKTPPFLKGSSYEPDLESFWLEEPAS